MTVFSIASPAPTIAASEKPSPAPRGTSVYQSDFQSGWAIFDELQVSSSHTIDGYMMNVHGPWAGWAYTTRLSRNEFYAEITARPSECPSGQGTYGLLFHYVDPSHFRAFVVWCSGLFSAFQRTETNRAALLVEGALPQVLDVSSGDHRIGVLSHNNTITFFVDEYQVGQINVTETLPGDIGPYVESTGSQTTSILFTDLNVYSP